MNRFTFSLIILAGSAMVGVFLLWPRYEILTSLQKEKIQKETNLTYHQEYAKGLAMLKREAEGKSSEIRIVQNSLPDTQELPSLYEQVGTIAAESGLVAKSVSISPSQSPSSPQVKSIDIDLGAEGSYEALKQFIQNTRKSPRIFTIKSFRLAGSVQQEMFQYSIQMEAYSY